MASTAVTTFLVQTCALTKKNVVIAVVRHPVSTFLRALALPIALIVLVLEVKTFLDIPSTYGVGSPHPIQPLTSQLLGGQPLALVVLPNLGPDVEEVVQKINALLSDVPKQVLRLHNETELLTHCPVSIHGTSGCFGAIVFTDSPQSPSGSHVWSYKIRTDPIQRGVPFDVLSTTNQEDTLYFPLQLAVENAMSNSSQVPYTYMFTQQTQEHADRQLRQHWQEVLVNQYSIALFIAMMSAVFHVASMMSSERQAGMAQLIDVMGGSASARVVSFVLAFGIIYLPCWIISGFVFWYLLFPHSNAAILVFWQILTGWSLTSASVFAASFFKTSQLSGVYIVVGFLVPGLGGMLLNAPGSGSVLPSTGTTAALTLLFPSFNYMALIGYYARYEVPGLPTDLLKAPTSASVGPGLAAVSELQGIVMWVFLVIQIIAYPALAIVLERVLHGVSFGSRTFDASQEAMGSQLVLQTSGLSKTYTLPWYKSLFKFRSKHTGDVHALEGLNMACQRQQILCLLGANGSGKTTTLDLIAGLHKPTTGSVTINAPPSRLGVCPQSNVLFSHLTVAEHVWVWSKVKGGHENAAGLAQIIESCDLGMKRNSLAKHLSGGQKRKLQLACMLVGGASLCLMDEVTTGLDPLSRRRIWNIILAERAKRSMLITTHFLDEAEVLADTIAIISRGHLKCLGPPAVLKNQFGGGYRVHAPCGNHVAADVARVDGVNSFIHQDRIVYNMPDATTAAQLMATFTHRGERDVQIAGPTIEDVFMRVSDELPETFMDDPASHSKAAEAEGGPPQLSQAQHPTSFWTQVRVLLHKRTLILRRNWWPYFFVLALPVAVTPALNRLLTFYHAPLCVDVLADAYSPTPYQLVSGGANGNHDKYSPLAATASMAVGPVSTSLNATLYGMLANFTIGQGFNLANYSHQVEWQDSFGGFQDIVQAQAASLTPGAIWMGSSSSSAGKDASGSTRATIAYLSEQGMFPALSMLNLWSQLRANMQINGAQQFLSSLFSPSAGSSLQYAAYFCLIQVVYPAFFALYPTGERTSHVRALQYSNGVRSLPLWTAYILFDLAFVVAIAVCILLTTWKQLPYWYNVAYFFPVLVLYGLSAMLMAFVVSALAKSQLAAFATVAGGLGAMFSVTIMSFSLEQAFTPPTSLQTTMDATAIAFGLFFPIANVFRAILVGLNVYLSACRDNEPISYPGAIYAYGGPILYLCLQIIVLLGVLLWLDRGEVSIFPHTSARIGGHVGSEDDDDDAEASGPGADEVSVVHPDVVAEAERVEESEADFLRLLHVSRRFGSNIAVKDVSLGLGGGEVLALLGPNGAGKTTIVNMIRGELKPNRGDILVRGVEVRGRTGQAQEHLGVCPQFDAFDALTVREHLTIYARIKGISTVRTDVDLVLAKVGLPEYAEKLAAKLSGGNKRKLSLAIALLGNPDILLLDEPSSAMDVIAKRTMWRTLAAIAPGRSLLLTTHSMEEADALASRAAILSRRLLAIGTTQSPRAAYSARYHVSLILTTAPLSRADETRTLEEWVDRELGGLGAALEPHSLGGQIKFTVPLAADSTAVSGEARGDAGDGAVLVGISAAEGGAAAAGGGIGAVIRKIEAGKKELGVAYYAIGSATLEHVFMSVVKENHVLEEDEKVGGRWWRRRS